MPTANSRAQDLDLPGWELSWNDEFDGSSLDLTKWVPLDRRDSFNQEEQYYHPDQVSVADGHLQLTAINTPRDGKNYQSGLVTSRDLFGPGRFEARIDLPTSQGMWPAFWLNANHVPWPQGGEIDIMENRGSQPNLVSSAYHWQKDPGPCCDEHRLVYREYAAVENGQLLDFHGGFHTYAAEWDDTTVKFFVNGNLYHTVTQTEERPIFDTPKNIILNLAVGGFFGGSPDGTTVWPQTMLVDYVRVWRPEGAPVDPDPVDPGLGDNLLRNPGFDNAGGSLADWNLIGNVIPNVSADSAMATDGSHALKIFGQFNGQTNTSGVWQGVAVTPGDSLVATASTRSPSWDTLAGKDNSVTMQVEFFDNRGVEIASAAGAGAVSQLLHDGSSPADLWLDHSLEAVVPEGAVEARLSLLFDQRSNDTGAVWIDGAGLFIVPPVLGGDYNNDGVVDTADYTVWRDNLGAPAGTLPNDVDGGQIDNRQYETWRSNFLEAAAEAAAATPEPASLSLVLALSLALHTRQR